MRGGEDSGGLAGVPGFLLAEGGVCGAASTGGGGGGAESQTALGGALLEGVGGGALEVAGVEVVGLLLAVLAEAAALAGVVREEAVLADPELLGDVRGEGELDVAARLGDDGLDVRPVVAVDCVLVELEDDVVNAVGDLCGVRGCAGG